MGIDEETLDNARKFLLNKDTAKDDKEQHRLEDDLARFNGNPLMSVSAAAYADRFCERGASWAMPHKVYCEKVGREIFFLEYSFKGEERDHCIEGKPGVPTCPYARKKECDKYEQFPFGRKKTVSIRIKK